MASISKLNTALLSMPNELTVAAANFNLDFSLIKVEAPKEFHGVRDALSSRRRDEAEEGQPHTTARKLGALFEAIIPAVPDLLQAYGKRASAISTELTTATQVKPNIDLFAAQTGIDGTSIWAAATSGKAALAMHLLACMLARIWKSHEAISLWVELVERRKAEILDTYNNNTVVETAAMMASKQAFTRQQLAQWDSSARSWLQTADGNRRIQQTQLMLIINNVQLPVNLIKDPYQSVIDAWRSAMSAMNRMVSGIPQQVQDGAILLAMSSWHLYPDMEVLANKTTKVDQNDGLLNGGLVTISAHGASSDKEGVFWSLPLSRMRFYSPPVVANRHISLGTSRITMDELWIVVLGIIISQWEHACADIDRCCKLITLLSTLVNSPSVTVPWLRYLSDAVLRYNGASDVDQRHAARLLGLGMRQCNSFLSPPGVIPPPFFGLSAFSTLTDIVPDTETQIAFMRRIAEKVCIPSQDLIIRYNGDMVQMGVIPGLATALPIPSTTYTEGEPVSKRRRRHDVQGGHFRLVHRVFAVEPGSCADSECSCVIKSGLECGCAKFGHACSVSCHPSLESLSRCNRSYVSQELEGVPCQHDSGRSPCNCRLSLLSRYVSATESRGERCCILEVGEIFKYDNRNFDISISFPIRPGEYDHLIGDEYGSSLFLRRDNENQGIRQQLGASASTSDIEWLLTRKTVNVANLRQYLKDLSTPHKSDQATSLNGLEFATQLYESLDGCTINIETIRQPLWEAEWVSFLTSPIPDIFSNHSPQKNSPDDCISTPIYPTESVDPRTDIELPKLAYLTADLGSNDTEIFRLSISFACIAMLETGEFNIHPKSLEGVMALSIGDSIYVATALISDPSASQSQCPLRRVMGNLGRSEMAFLIPPSSPRLENHDLTSWNLVNHLPFDGAFEDNFSATSLHLSFTDFEPPLDVGVRGLRDTLVVIVESLVSVNDRGKHLGDLDILSLFRSQHVVIMDNCSHTIAADNDSMVQNLISIDCWAEFLDLPRATGIVRAHGNWQARLAIAAASSQRSKRTLILPQKPCIRCLSDRDDLRRFDVIIA